jgi:ligand-binding SRPBCC domain-containing protein
VGRQIQFEQWVPVELRHVFLFFANPQNLPRIMPPSMATRLERINLAPPFPSGQGQAGTSELAGVGSEIITSFRVLTFLPVRAGWTARITEFEWEHHFADIQERGPFKSFYHRHEFGAETRDGTRGTRVRDVIEYDVGYGVFGALAERLWTTKQLARTFEYRQGALERLLSSAL